jgi:multidrug resistance efflux pump
VTPAFDWVRLAQRIPVRIQIDQVPDGVTLIAGRTATVTIEPDAPAAPAAPARASL